MNQLQDIIKYRTTCLIHNIPMEIVCIVPFFLVAYMDDKGMNLIIKEAKKPSFGISFHFDGTYHYQNAEGKLLNITESSPMQFAARCVYCAPLRTARDRKMGGPTTLQDIRSICHYYTFCMVREENDTFGCYLEKEIIRYNKDDKFYHMMANLSDKSATFRMGSCNNKELIGQLLDSMMHIDVPKFDSSAIQSIDQIIEKIKIYNLFS